MPQEPICLNVTTPPPKVVTLSVTKHGPPVSGNALDGVARTAAFTATLRTIHTVDLTAGGMTVTPPSGASPGDEFGLLDVTPLASENVVTVDFTGAKILGAADTYLMASGRGNAVTFIYLGVAAGWGVLSKSN